jgi:hypothetical protein
VKVTPLGRVALPSLRVGGVGKEWPVLTVKLPALPTLNVVWSALVMLGASSTVRMKVWVAFGATPLLAVIVKVYVPPVPLAGVPARVAVPSPLSTKVTPLGRVALPSLSAGGVGNEWPVVTLKVPLCPTVKVVALPLVIEGGSSTVSVKLWVPFGVTPLLAVMVKLYVPPVPAAGVPLRTPAELRVTPEGSVPLSLKVGAGNPSAVTLKVPLCPTVKVVLFALVMVGG